MADPLTDDEQQILRKQFGDVYIDAQKTFDSSVRTLAAAGVAVTVALATALEKLAWSGAIAVFIFLLSLGCNLVSYWTAQHDMRLRLDAVWARDRVAVWEGNRWTTRTHRLNFGAGLALIIGGLRARWKPLLMGEIV